MPFVTKIIEEGTVITNLLLQHLRENDVKATGFVVGSTVNKEGEYVERLKLLEKWRSDGHLLANHTYSHLTFSEQSLEDFENDVIRNEKILAPFLDKKAHENPCFRFPYMEYGNTTEQMEKALDFLHSRSYTVAPISLDTKDYIFNILYINGYEHTEELYLEYVEKIVDFREQQAIHFYGKYLGQIMLIHSNLINAYCLGKVLAFLKRREYEFVSLQEVMSEPVYQDVFPIINARNFFSWESKTNDGKHVLIKYPSIDPIVLEAFNRYKSKNE